MLRIPEPCNEDFSKMTPTERGAFCSKCQIDTFDFKKLSDHQVNKILFEHQNEHLCGQFTTRQLNSLNRGYLNWRNQKTSTFRSKFVLALVFVFGLSLFSCNNQEKEAIIAIQQMELTQQPEPKLNYINESFSDPDFSLIDYVDNVEPPVIPMPGIVEIGPEPIECTVDGIPEFEPDLEEIMITSGEAMMQGGTSLNLGYMDYLKETVLPSVEESVLPESEMIGVTSFELAAFPNPTTSSTVLQLNVKVSGKFEIGLFDMAGNFVQPIYTGELEEGERRFEIELANRPSGMYVVNVIGSGYHETIKIQKMN